MKKFSKILALMLTLSLVLSGCQTASDDGKSDVEAKGESEKVVDDKKEEEIPTNDIKIGIIQHAEHPALDAAREGFVEVLLENGVLEDNIDIGNAQGDNANLAPIATKFVNNDVDLILAIGTGAAQTAAQATKDIPILVTAVTDPALAGVVETNELPNTNVSGTSDMNPIQEQVDLLLQFVPDAQNVGIMYCSSEINSQLQADIALEIMEGMGISAKFYTAAESNEIQALVQSVVGKVDAIYIPTDNLFASSIGTVALVANPNKIPVICGESGPVDGGALATYGIDYKALGAQTGEQAIEILFNGADVSTMPIEYSPIEDLAVKINEETAKAIGIEIPESIGMGIPEDKDETSEDKDDK